MEQRVVVYLIARTYEIDEFSVRFPVEEKRKAYASVSSISRTDFFEGARVGLNLELRFDMARCEYKGEEILEYNGNRYQVERTYSYSDRFCDNIELYCTRRKGAEKKWQDQ